MFGVDVSQHNTLTQSQFDHLKNGGIGFCVVRASIGMDIDTKSESYSRMAYDSGMLVGAYHYLKPDFGIEQAVTFARSCEDMKGLNFWVLDVEASGVTQLDVANFVASLDHMGLGLYTRPGLLDKYAKVLPHFSYQWLAYYPDDFVNVRLARLEGKDYSVAPGPLWQFTESMKFSDGTVLANIDGDYFKGDEVDFLRYVGAIN